MSLGGGLLRRGERANRQQKLAVGVTKSGKADLEVSDEVVTVNRLLEAGDGHLGTK